MLHVCLKNEKRVSLRSSVRIAVKCDIVVLDNVIAAFVGPDAQRL